MPVGIQDLALTGRLRLPTSPTTEAAKSFEMQRSLQAISVRVSVSRIDWL